MRPTYLIGFSVLLFVLIGLVGAYEMAAQPGADLAQGLVQTAVYLLSPWMLGAESVAAAFLAYGYVFVRSAPWKAVAASTIGGLLRRLRLRLLLAFALFSLAIVGLGGMFGWFLDHEAHQQGLIQTQTIARLKAQQVDKWL
jgi:hypothetical protein